MDKQRFTSTNQPTEPQKQPKTWLKPALLLVAITVGVGTLYTLVDKEEGTDKDKAQQEVIDKQATKETNYKENFDPHSGLTAEQEKAVTSFSQPESNQKAISGVQTGQKVLYNELNEKGVLEPLYEIYQTVDFNTAVDVEGFNVIIMYMQDTANVVNINKTLADLTTNPLDTAIHIIDATSKDNQQQYLTYLANQGVYASVTPITDLYAMILHNGIYYTSIEKSDTVNAFTRQNLEQIIEEVNRVEN